jgi:hypothetical protein
LQRRLAWYGFRSVKVGQVRELSEQALVVDLLYTCGTLLCRIEIDRQSGAIRRPAAHGLVYLLASLGPGDDETWVTDGRANGKLISRLWDRSLQVPGAWGWA